ncbi:hypothetical protein VTN02DRAFT_4070 [Thermoascus thermophilus]
MKHLVCGTLTEEYGLNKNGKFQPVVNDNDLLYLVHHSMAISEEGPSHTSGPPKDWASSRSACAYTILSARTLYQ